MIRFTSMRTWIVLLCCLAATVAQAQPAPGGGVETQTATVTWTSGTYLYDGSGNIKSIDGREFTYDAFGRLTRGKVDGTNVQTFTYDDFGNMLTVTTNSATATRFGVDPATNQMSKTTDPAGTPYNGYAAYDADGSIRSTVTGDTFTYDALGMVTESQVGGNRTVHLYSPSDERIASVAIVGNAAAGKQWTIRNPSGAVLTRFTQTAAGVWSWDEDYIYGAGRLLAAKVSGPEKVRHFHNDHLGTPRVITGNGGAEISRHTYFPFGEELTASTDTERAKFTGHERDDPTLDYMHARYYAVKWGRFLSGDPVMDIKRATSHTQAWNRYAYVENNPVNATDPNGREIYFQVHPVAFGQSHTSIRIEPVDQGRYAQDADFQQFKNPSTGRSFMTLGAGSEGGRLVSNVNRTRDVDLTIKTTVVKIDLKGKDETSVVTALRAADGKYKDNLPYAAFPMPTATMQVFGKTVPLNTATYNSNSYAAGLLLAVGLIPPNVPESTPGKDQPLPKKEFQ